VLIGDLPGGDLQSRATASSTDGSIIVGAGSSANGREASLWTAEDGIKDLGDLPGGLFLSEALGVSADGSVVVGQGHSGTTEAFRWQSETGMEGLGFLPGGKRHSIAYDVSADALTITGHSQVPFREGGAFRWTAEEGMHDLGNPPPAQLQMSGGAISADGLRIAGNTSSGTLPAFAFRWDLEHGYEIFNALGSFGLASIGVYATNGDGTVIVGSSSTQTHNEEAFVWDHLRGIQGLRDILEVDYGVDLTGWRLYLAADVSDDGRVIAGASVNPDGLREGWVVTFPIQTGTDIKPGNPLTLGPVLSHLPCTPFQPRNSATPPRLGPERTFSDIDGRHALS
jgi:probable HAF family extracellular repeat protein